MLRQGLHPKVSTRDKRIDIFADIVSGVNPDRAISRDSYIRKVVLLLPHENSSRFI